MVEIYEAATIVVAVVAIIVSVFFEFRPQDITFKLIRHNSHVDKPIKSNTALEVSHPDKPIKKVTIWAATSTSVMNPTERKSKCLATSVFNRYIV